MLGISTNLSSYIAQKSFANSTKLLNQAIERMTTGFKINGAKDNAANYAITERMTTQLSSLDVVEDNTAQGIDIVATANDTLDLINERFTRLRDLAIQAENKTYGEESLRAINLECESLVKEIKNIYVTAEYNGLKIFGTEFYETVPTTTTYANPAPPTFATEDTTLQELGISESNFQIYNSNNELIESYDTEKTDSLADIFRVLSNYGMSATITDGVISISSSNGRYVNGDLMRALGIELEQTDFVKSTEQSSNSAICYLATMTASETTTFADIGALTNGTDVVVVKNKYGDDLASFNVSSTTTLGGLFNSLGNYNIQGEIDDGVISLSSSDGNYVLSQGVIANMGLATVESSSLVTLGMGQTSSGVVTYESVLVSGGSVITTQQEQTVTIWTTTTTSETLTNTIWTTTTSSETLTETIWTTTTTSETLTNTIWTTTTSSETLTETIWITTTTSETLTNTIWTTTTSSETLTETIWTTTTTSETLTNTIWTTTTSSQVTTTPITYTAIVTATLETTLGELGITDGMTYILNSRSGTTLGAKTTATVASTDTIQDLIDEFNSTGAIEASFSGGVITLKTSSDFSEGRIVTGAVAEALGIGYSRFSADYISTSRTWVNQGFEYSTINNTVTSTVTAGEFKEAVARIDTSSIASLSSLAETDTIAAGSTYKISTAEELVQFATMVSNGLLRSSYNGSVTIVLANDIDMSGIDWTGIWGCDYLIFEGNGQVISNLTGSSGLFSGCLSYSNVNNLGLKDVNLSFEKDAGGITTETWGTRINNCFVTGSLSVMVENGDWVGGLIGHSNMVSEVTNSYVSILATGECDGSFGGIVGDSSSLKIEDCYSEGSYYISGYGSVGGIVGCCTGGVINNVQSSFELDVTHLATTGGIIGKLEDETSLQNVYFNGTLANYGGAIIGEASTWSTEQDFVLDGIGCANTSYELFGNDSLERALKYEDKIEDLVGDVRNDRNITIEITTTGGVLETITVDKTKTLAEFRDILSGYDIELRLDDFTFEIAPYLEGVVINTTNVGSLRTTTFIKNSKSGVLSSNEVTEENHYETIYVTTTSSSTETETIWTTTTSSETQTETVWTTTTSSSTETETVWTTTTSSETQTETVWMTTTSSSTETETVWTTTTSSETQTETVWTTTTSLSTVTETIWETTTSSTTQTQIVDVTQTLGGSATTVSVSITSDMTFSELGLSSRAYVTVMNDTTKTIVTIKTADTVASLITKLNRAGVTTTLTNGELSITPNNKKVYISGMSDSLKDIFKLENDFYSTSLGVEMTDSNIFIYDGETTIRQTTSLSDIGVTSGELVVKKDGTEHSTIVVSESQTIAELLLDLRNAGFNAQCTNGVLSVKAEGDKVLAESANNSSNAVLLLRLADIQQTVDSSFTNKDSAELNKLTEIVNSYWKATSSIALQVGTSNDEHNTIEISTGFTLYNLDRFANIGKNMVNQIDFIAELDNVLAMINEKQTHLGASENRLMSVLEEISIKYDNLVSSRSTLRDADLADETSIYIQQQILQQASATLLSVANQTPQLALQLL